MQFLESSCTDPYYNLALEDHIFQQFAQTQDCFLLWQNQPCVVVGKNQNTLEEINSRYIHEHNILVARRNSGGGAVYHDLGNLNYTFIVHPARNEVLSFQEFVQPLILTLRKLGIEAQSSGRNDVLIAGKKVSGSAQYAKNGRLLHHGCILVNCDVDALSGALNVSENKFRSKGIKSVRSRVTCVNDHLSRPLTVEEFKRIFIRQVSMEQTLRPIELGAEDLRRVRELRDHQYATWEWNYGGSPPCGVRKEKRYPFGTVAICMELRGDDIEKVKIYGDFFGQEDISGLEQLLCGKHLKPESFQFLSDEEVDRYVSGLTQDKLIELLSF